MEINLKKNQKLSKIITGILIGILLLIIAMPVKNNTTNNSSKDNGSNEVFTYDTYASYFETKLTNILEESYGKGTMQVMVHLIEKADSDGLYNYGASENTYCIDGVFIVAKVNSKQAVADITYAVCALFDIPAHKCAVIIKK